MSTFTTRHYQVVAAKLNEELRDIKECPEISATEAVERVALRLANVFVSDNAAFDPGLYFNAVHLGV